MTVEQLESEIEKLAPAEFRKLADWITERDQERWDRQLEHDAATGRLDALADEALGSRTTQVRIAGS